MANKLLQIAYMYILILRYKYVRLCTYVAMKFKHSIDSLWARQPVSERVSRKGYAELIRRFDARQSQQQLT